MSKHWITVGKFGRPHGVKGLITVISYTQPRENLLNYRPWHILKNDDWSPLSLKHVTVRDKLILAEVNNYETREQVACLTNLELAIYDEQLPELAPGEYYWHQLMGMNVINSHGAWLGQISEIMPTGANDVLVIQGEQRFLIPYLPGDVIIHVDKEKQTMTVNWEMNI